MVICAIATANHLPKAACLAKSLNNTQLGHTLILFLVERNTLDIGALGTHFQRIVFVSELEIVGLESLLFRYSAAEACMALKARALLWAIREFADEDNFIFLDNDIVAYSRFEELEFALPRAQILLTPHHVHDEYTRETISDNMFRTLLCGIFNSGFVAVRRSPMALSFLRWWDGKLAKFCYKDEARGLYCDQKWLDAALAHFDITVFREPGYNVANWNLASRRLTRSTETGYMVNGRPLRFFHFSMIDAGRDLFYFRRHVKATNPVFQMRNDYLAEIGVMDTLAYSRLPWSYDFYHSGECIDPEVRRAWRYLAEFTDQVPDPFNQSNVAIRSIEGPHMGAESSPPVLIPDESALF